MWVHASSCMFVDTYSYVHVWNSEVYCSRGTVCLGVQGVSPADLKLSDWAWLLASRCRGPCVHITAVGLECPPLYLASLCGS